jgi:hypothetical protein
VTRPLQILIASSDENFLRRFESACSAMSLSAGVASDGFEALSCLEAGCFDLALLDGGGGAESSGLTGIAADILSHMWRQIEGRANHLVIAYVAHRDSGQLSRGVSVGREVSPRAIDPAFLLENRGIDRLSWSDEAEAVVIGGLLDAFYERENAKIAALECCADPHVIRLSGRRQHLG